MENNKKLDINNIYVGELYLSCGLGSFADGHCLSKKEIEEINKMAKITNNGAINISANGRFTDLEKRRSYECALTLFYKDNDQYKSLHNGINYGTEGIDFCKGLVPLTELLPKVDFNAPKELTENEAKRYFDILFNSNLFDKVARLYSPVKHNINEFYVGTLNLYDGYLPDNKSMNMYQFSNLPQKYMLYRSGAKLGCIYGYYGESKDEYGNIYDNHSTFDFECLFMNTDNGLYSIHNHQIYNNGTMDNEHLIDIPLGENHYERIKSFEEYLDMKKIKHYPKEITVPKSLKLYRKGK